MKPQHFWRISFGTGCALVFGVGYFLFWASWFVFLASVASGLYAFMGIWGWRNEKSKIFGEERK